MKRRGICITSIFLLLIGCAAQTNLKDYKPKSSDEEAIIKVLITGNEALHDQDLSGYMATFHDNATIRAGTASASGFHPVVPMISKKEFSEVYLVSNWVAFAQIKNLNPEITVSGDKATLTCLDEKHGYYWEYTYDMVKENDKWYIMKLNWRDF
jgi:hypothetical protein